MLAARPFVKPRYRATLAIITEILQACMDAGVNGILVSGISQKTNLSHNSVVGNCQKLIESGLLKSMRNKRNHIFVITEKGKSFFQDFQKFHGTIGELDVRY